MNFFLLYWIADVLDHLFMISIFFTYVFRIPMKLKKTDENSNLNLNIKSYFITNCCNAILT